MGLLSILLGIFGSGKKTDIPYEISETYLGLRELVFNLDPNTIGAADSNKPVYAVLMETGFPNAVVTLAAISDGTVSLYFSNGGGILGSGQHEGPRRICMEYLQTAKDYLDPCTKAEAHPLPGRGQTIFYILTIDKGVLTAQAKEDDLGYNRHALSPLFQKAQELITAIRITQEKQKK